MGLWELFLGPSVGPPLQGALRADTSNLCDTSNTWVCRACPSSVSRKASTGRLIEVPTPTVLG